jgi:hypothetical protein
MCFVIPLSVECRITNFLIYFVENYINYRLFNKFNIKIIAPCLDFLKDINTKYIYCICGEFVGYSNINTYFTYPQNLM